MILSFPCQPKVPKVFCQVVELIGFIFNWVDWLVRVLHFGKPEYNGDGISLVPENQCNLVLPAVFFSCTQAFVSSGDWFR